MTARAGDSQAGKVGCALQDSLWPRVLWPGVQGWELWGQMEAVYVWYQ